MNAEKETYIRRRAFNKIHVTSWLIYLEKDGFVRCPFQKCNFMAFDVNEMCEHYGFCKGDTNFMAKHVCEVCNSCTVSERRLNEHRSRAHNITILPGQAEAAAEPEPAEPCKPSKVLMLSWGFFFDKHNYIKCSNCQYIANTMSEMCHHYLVCNKEKKLLRYVCPECKGRSRDVAPLLQHLERAHNITKRPDQFNHISRNMVQFWEKELREDTYATCLHINSEKERDCRYIDVELLGINEHSQTCKGPQNITSAKQWFCQFCDKWTNSEDKLKKHEELTHCKEDMELLSRWTQVEENEQSNHPISAVHTVKLEVTSSLEPLDSLKYSSSQVPRQLTPTTVLRQTTPAKKQVPFQSKQTTNSSVKGSQVPVKPFKTVIIMKKDGDIGSHQRLQNTIEKVNNGNESYPNCLQNGNNPGHIISPIINPVKTYNGERRLHSAIESNKHVDNVNGKERSFTRLCKPERQEIYLDLVEDKLVARQRAGEAEIKRDSSSFISREYMCEIPDSSTLHLRTYKRDKRFEDQAIEIIDVAENEFVPGKYEITNSNQDISETREPAVIKVEEAFGFDEESEDGGSILQGSMYSGCIRDSKSSSLFDDKKSIRLSGAQNLYQDEAVIDAESSAVRKDQVKELSKKQESCLVDSGKKEANICENLVKPTFNLFKDDSSSDEEDHAEKCVKGDKEEDEMKPTYSWQSENKPNNIKSSKNYSRRKSNDNKPERCSPSKPTNCLRNQNNHAASELCNVDLEEVGRKIDLTYKGRKSCDNHYKTQIETRNSLVFPNRINNFDDIQEGASKNSEKNDKLMLKENSLQNVNIEDSSLSDKKQIISHGKESVPEVEKLTTSEHFFDQTTNNDLAKCHNESDHKSFGNIKFSRTKLALDKCNEPKHLESFVVDFISESESNIQETEKSKLLNFSPNIEEPIQTNSIKHKDCVDLTKYDAKASSKEGKVGDQLSSLISINSKNSTNNEVTVIKENYDVSKESKVVSFFYSGKLNKPFLGSNTSNNKKRTENSKLSVYRSLFGKKSNFLPNEPCSSKHQFVDEPLYCSGGTDQYSVNKLETNIEQVDGNLVNIDSKMDVVSRIQADFLIDSSSDEEITVTKAMRNGRSENQAEGTETAERSTGKNPVAIKTGSASGMAAESSEKNVTDLGSKSEVRRISSDFFEESSLDEEDFLGTDEELDMKDKFFNGFQELTENLNSKNRWFRQFLNRLSESENEEWYVNAGNLTMDVRKDINLSRSTKVNLKNNIENNSLRSLDKEIAVIVVNDDSNDKEHVIVNPKEELFNLSPPNLKSKSKGNNEIKYKEIHDKSKKGFIRKVIYKHKKFIHKKGFMGDECNMNETEKLSNERSDFETAKELLSDNFSKENRLSVSCVDSKPMESLKVSLSIDKLNLTGKERKLNMSLKEAEEDWTCKTAEVSKVIANNNSIGNILSEKVCGNKEKYAVVEELPDSLSCNSDEEVGKEPVIAAEPGSEVGTIVNSNTFEIQMENHNITNHKQQDSDISNQFNLKIKYTVPSGQENNVITENSLYSEMEVNNEKEVSLMAGVTVSDSESGSNKSDTDLKQTSKYPEENPKINDRSSRSQLMPKPSCSGKLITNVCDNNLHQIACSTPLKQTETVSHETPDDNSPKTSSSSFWEDEMDPNPNFDSTTNSDDEPLSIIQKASQSSIKAVLTEGFSPHVHSHGNNINQDKLSEKKHFESTETNHNNVNGVNLDVENINVMKSVKKRGRKPKINQDEFKVKLGTINSSNDGFNKTKRNTTEGLENAIPKGSSNDDNAFFGTSSLTELSFTELASESSAGLDYSSLSDTPAPIKRKGRPPKRKNKDLSTKNKGEDCDKFYGLTSDDELLISIYSEEVENLLVNGRSEGSNYYNQDRTASGMFGSVEKENEAVLACSESLSTPRQDLQMNTVPGISEIKVPKKRGRKPKLETNTFECTANSSTTDRVLQNKEENCQDVVNDLSTDILNETVEFKAPKKRGRKSKLLKPNSSECTFDTTNSSISDMVLQNVENFQGGVKDLSMEDQLETVKIMVPKKRGRKSKFKLENTSSECTLDTANSSRSHLVLHNDEENCQEMVKDVSMEKVTEAGEIKVPKKRGRKPKLKLEKNSFECTLDDSSIKDETKDLSTETLSNTNEIKVPKKRGRKPKLKPESNSSESTITANSSMKVEVLPNDETDYTNLANSPIKESSSVITVPKKRGRRAKEVEEDVVLPKKRGRKPVSKVNLDSTLNQKPTNMENKKIFDKTESLSRKRKLNSDINDRSNEVSNITDVDCNSSVTSELHGTDLILINEEKLYGSSIKRSRRCKDKPKKLEVSNDNDSDVYEPVEFSSEDSGDESFKTPRQSNKLNKIDSDEASDIETEGNTTIRGRKKFPPKTLRDKVYYQIKHRASDKVVCGVCKQEMTYSNFKTHNTSKHYMLSWLEGEEEPVDMKDQKEIENRLWYAKKRMGKVPFRCFVCNLPKLSAVGFYSHILFCGKDSKERESLLVTCELCQTKLMPSSFRAHMYMKHSAKPAADAEVPQTEAVKGMRSAAVRAVEVMQQCQAECQEGEGGSRPNSPDRRSRLLHLYVRPSKVVPSQEYNRWKDSLTTAHVVTCAIEGCGFTADSTIGFRKHFFSCPLAPPRLFKCRVCSFTAKEEEPMLDHVEEHEGFNFDGSDESTDESDGEQKQPKPSIGQLLGSSLPFKFLKNLKLLNRTGRHESKKKFFTPALTWTLNLRNCMFASETLYREAQPSTRCEPLTAETVAPYLPELSQSVRFRGTSGEWQRLQRFHSCFLNGVRVLFAGGPVWATAWAPVPYPEEHQYLAVASHTSVELTHKMATVYNYPGLIQVWALGPLTNTDDEACSPRLVVGLGQRRGPVWGLAWCPAGAYTQERLGLLAAACGDGSIAVYAVPRVTDHVGDPEACCVEATPVWDLRLGCEMMTQCTCLDWHSAAPHSIIVGGFANGLVALWDLTTTSQLLKTDSTILPYRVVEAHHSAVTAVQLSCTKENVHMMTASLDRSTKFWKLDDSVTFVNRLQKACVLDAVMPNHWLMSVNAYDDVYSINSSHVTGFSYRETFTTSNTNFILQAGSTWGVSFNDWLNGCAYASEMGKVNAFFRSQLMVSEDSKKVNKSAFVEDLVLCSARSIKDGSPVASGFGPLYSDCASTVGLEFDFGGNAKLPKTSCSSDNMDSFPIRSFNTVTWNPNMGSFTWLAAGMQCGLVAIPRITSLKAEDVAELNKHKDDR